MSDRWRCFVAVPIGEALRADLAVAVDGWRAEAAAGGLRWGDPPSWHLTLAFLGATRPEAVADVSTAVASIAATHRPMRLRTGGVGAFPSADRARVVWYGVGDADGRLAALAGDLRDALGLDPVERLRPHVTLARAPGRPLDLRPWAQRAAAPAGELRVDEVQVMRTHLGGGPARYEILASAPMGAAAHV
jgi:2'-5' RNA ligase